MSWAAQGAVCASARPVCPTGGMLVQKVKYNLGLTRARPQFGRFTYTEKMGYFALLWGTLVIVVTGLALWFEVPFLNGFPFWGFELATVVHDYEAILATLAIVV